MWSLYIETYQVLLKLFIRKNSQLCFFYLKSKKIAKHSDEEIREPPAKKNLNLERKIK